MSSIPRVPGGCPSQLAFRAFGLRIYTEDQGYAKNLGIGVEVPDAIHVERHDVRLFQTIRFVIRVARQFQVQPLPSLQLRSLSDWFRKNVSPIRRSSRMDFHLAPELLTPSAARSRRLRLLLRPGFGR